MIVQMLQNHGHCPTSLLDILATERSRDRFTSEDLSNATATLGFGAEGPSRPDFGDEIPESFIEDGLEGMFDDFVEGSGARLGDA
jgi:ubiquitin carboxyl-terminal hydrolase 25/28